MLSDWEFWLRLLAVVGFCVGAYRGYRHSIATGQLSPKGFFLIVAAGLAYAAIGVGLMLGLAELLGPAQGGTVAFIFIGYLVFGVLAVVWLSIRIARRHRPQQGANSSVAKPADLSRSS